MYSNYFHWNLTHQTSVQYKSGTLTKIGPKNLHLKSRQNLPAYIIYLKLFNYKETLKTCTANSFSGAKFWPQSVSIPPIYIPRKWQAKPLSFFEIILNCHKTFIYILLKLLNTLSWQLIYSLYISAYIIHTILI